MRVPFRLFVTSSHRFLNMGPGPRNFTTNPRLFVSFEAPSGMEVDCTYRPGQSLLDVSFENDIGIEGACGGQCACSTCHVLLKDEDSIAMFGEKGDTESDLLEMAPGSNAFSRLACQLRLQTHHHQCKFQLPQKVRNQLKPISE
eukprot:GHVS01064371.1.p1 GENE.GHVS01064371.1~~GHVS01064371.1.p1  ORF type:complete len:144 (+),score=16.37 GHVS01064371.1:813-1244(+)